MSVPFDLDRRAFVAGLGGAAAVALMDHEARAEALEEYTENTLDALVAQNRGGVAAPAQGGAVGRFPTVAELEAQIRSRTCGGRSSIPTRRSRRADASTRRGARVVD